MLSPYTIIIIIHAQVGSNTALPPALEETTGSEISSEETSTVTGVEDLASGEQPYLPVL